MNRPSQRGQSAAPIIVFVGIVSLSVIFFFVFTMPTCGKKPAVVSAGTPPPAPAPVAPQPKPVVPEVKTEPPTPVAPVAPPKPFYMKSSQFLAAVSEKLAAGKVEETMDLLAPTVPAERRDFYKKIFTSGYRPVSTAMPWKEIGRISGQERWALPLEIPQSTAAVVTPPPAPALDPTAPLAPPTIDPPSLDPAAPAPVPTPDPAKKEKEKQVSAELLVDLKLSREEGYQITGLRFSPDLLADAGGAGNAALVDSPDPLTISHDFIHELLGKNFRGARLITDGTKVTHEKLAGLCIVFEEGDYTMVPGSSLNVTAATAERAWALVRVKSPKQNVESEFGVEMSKDAKNNWKVDSLDFSKLLQTYVQSTDAGKVYYTPIVKSPNGGESLVVYFEYDKSELTERGLHQMEIVADLLKSDPARKMRLSGYADALGSEDYNYILSKKRAEAVQKKLTELGVAPEQIVSRGFGAEAPLDPNKKEDGSDNPEGRSRNRRTEIYLDF